VEVSWLHSFHQFPGAGAQAPNPGAGPEMNEQRTTEEWVGQTIAGKYRVEGLLGKGGMGLVLHARHVRLDEQVAIKVLLPAMLEVPGMTTRFLREAQAASKIKSRHVARVSDVDVLPSGAPYMIMEYLDGMSLAQVRRQKGPLEIPEAVRCVLEACDAIAEAHSLGIVHRDLKPANLFLAKGHDGEEIVKVLDFGISKVDAPGEQDTTQTGQMMGSPKYMAPEQMLSMHDVDGRSDIWSLGAILYDFVAGRPPFMAETVAQLCALVLHDRPGSPRKHRPDLPEGVEAVILRCLERDRANRFANVAELVAALAPFAPPGARIPTPRVPSTSGLFTPPSRSSIRLVAPSALRPAPDGEQADAAKADADKPTADIALAVRSPASPSGTPTAMMPGANVSLGVSTLVEGAGTAAPRRRSRSVGVAVGAALVLLAAGGFALRVMNDPLPIPTAGASTAGPKLAPLVGNAGAPVGATASVETTAPPPVTPPSEAPTGAPTEAATVASGTPTVAVRRGPMPVRPLKPATEAPATDPFGGRRR
jgi:serine/threonine protein kinase